MKFASPKFYLSNDKCKDHHKITSWRLNLDQMNLSPKINPSFNLVENSIPMQVIVIMTSSTRSIARNLLLR